MDYPIPWATILRLSGAILTHRQIDFRAEAQAWVKRLRPPLLILGAENRPTSGPALLVVNHFSGPGFHPWWFVSGISGVLDARLRWITAEAWTYPDRLRSHIVTPLSQVIFRRLARACGFFPMPPMPPRPGDVSARARAVWEVLAAGRGDRSLVIGLAPEGGDTPGGVLQAPPPGAGRFILLLTGMGFRIYPVGTYEQAGRFCLNFGPPASLSISPSLPAGLRDSQASEFVMRQIAALIPSHLRGEFDPDC